MQMSDSTFFLYMKCGEAGSDCPFSLVGERESLITGITAIISGSCRLESETTTVEWLVRRWAAYASHRYTLLLKTYLTFGWISLVR